MTLHTGKTNTKPKGSPFLRMAANYTIVEGADPKALADDFHCLHESGMAALGAEAEPPSLVLCASLYLLQQGFAVFQEFERRRDGPGSAVPKPEGIESHAAPFFRLAASYTIASDATSRALVDDCQVLYASGMAALFADAEQLSGAQGAAFLLLQQACAVLEEIQRLVMEVDAVITASNSAVLSH
jgi:hypothetical protein